MSAARRDVHDHREVFVTTGVPGWLLRVRSRRCCSLDGLLIRRGADDEL